MNCLGDIKVQRCPSSPKHDLRTYAERQMGRKKPTDLTFNLKAFAPRH